MATITVEDGTVIANATSYASEAELTAYIGERNITLGATNGDASELLIKAMDYLEAKDFVGNIYSSTQKLQWPRLNVVIDGFYIDRETIPLLLKEAQMEIAISIDAGTNPLANLARETIKEKVGDIEVEYSPNARAVEYLTAAENKLNKLVKKRMVAYRG